MTSFAIDWSLFFSTFGLIFLAELPDKTAFACLIMGARNHPIAVFLGVAVAFVIQSLIAVIAGHVISLAPERWVHLAAGILFLIFAFMMRKGKESEFDENQAARGLKFWKSAWTAFVVIFIAEWGDLTQLATATLQAKYNSAFTIFTAATLALWTVSGLGVAIGHTFHSRVPPRLLTRGASLIFGLVGIYFIVDSLRAFAG